MYVESRERSTGMGATRYAAVAVDGKWLRVSRLEGARYHGRVTGEEVYSIHVPDATARASFYRSNSGRQEVTIWEGLGVESPVVAHSFEDADWWLADWSAAEAAREAMMAAGPEPVQQS